MSDSPRTDLLIAQVMEKYPGQTPAAQARYFEAVHQEIAPLCRELEREVTQLKDEVKSLKHQLALQYAGPLQARK